MYDPIYNERHKGAHLVGVEIYTPHVVVACTGCFDFNTANWDSEISVVVRFILAYIAIYTCRRDLYRDEDLRIAGPSDAGRRGSFYRLVLSLFPMPFSK